MNMLLVGWKQIENYCGKCRRTLKEWDKHVKLPVIKTSAHKSGSISIETEVLVAWLKKLSSTRRVYKPRKLK